MTIWRLQTFFDQFVLGLFSCFMLYTYANNLLKLGMIWKRRNLILFFNSEYNYRLVGLKSLLPSCVCEKVNLSLFLRMWMG